MLFLNWRGVNTFLKMYPVPLKTLLVVGHSLANVKINIFGNPPFDDALALSTSRKGVNAFFYLVH